MKPARVLALLAVPLFAYQAWTLAGWLADGPHQITEFRDRDSTSWYAARVAEVLILAGTLVIAGIVVRDCLRKRRLTFDAMLIIGLTTAAFWDPIYNWITPAWLYSSNWLNLNDWFAHAPLALNPDHGRMPWPIFPVLVGYSFWGLAFAALDNAVMRRVRRRRPGIGPAGLVAVAFASAGTTTVVAFGVFKLLDLMHAPGFRATFLADNEFAFFFWSGGIVFGAIACLRFFLDENGLALPERGTEGMSPSRRTVVSLLATIATCQLVVIAGWGLLSVPATLYSAPYPETPAHLINGLCDAPGITGTEYGPCPGGDGFRVPLR